MGIHELPKNPENAYDFAKTHEMAALQEVFDSRPSREELEALGSIGIAGRVMAKRDMGGVVFDTVVDYTGSMQVISTPETTGFDDLCKTQVGDWIGVVGVPVYSRNGTPSVMAADWSYLARTEIPFPSPKDGISDDEIRVRQRYLDLTVNRDSLARFRQRSAIVQAIREYMANDNFMEVETPTFHPIAGGASARPFETHHNALDTDLYLRVAPELYLKRLVVGGLERVYEIGKSYRNEGISTRHNPEFTMMEVYAAYWDCEDQMSFTERLVNTVVQKTRRAEVIEYQGVEIDFGLPWRRVPMDELVSEATGEDLTVESDIAKVRKICDALGITYADSFGAGRLIAEIYEELAEKNLTDPTFVVDYPTEISPLAREHRTKPGYTERFETVVAGRELCNGYTELNNATIQLERFLEQEGLKADDPEAMNVDHEYVRALRYGLPPTGGMGIGIDRLAMLIVDTHSIRDVILFPSLRPLPSHTDKIDSGEM
jgi:lysyl-tRNA synthetase class 2